MTNRDRHRLGSALDDGEFDLADRDGVVVDRQDISWWWMSDVPSRMTTEYPDLPLTRVVAEEALTS